MMTALLSLMSCGRIQCVISSAAYPLATETKSRGQKQKAVTSLNSSAWPVTSTLPPGIPPPNTIPRALWRQTYRKEGTSGKNEDRQGLFGLDFLVYARGNYHLPQHWEIRHVGNEFMEREFSQFICRKIRNRGGKKISTQCSKASSQPQYKHHPQHSPIPTQGTRGNIQIQSSA